MKTNLMPVMFVGHGNPMNAIEENKFSRMWEEVGKTLPEPKAILCISAHWESWGTLVTPGSRPKTIHDFGGFPRELYQVKYPAPGSTWLVDKVQELLGNEATPSDTWGLDHGCWSVLKRMFPGADVPVVQLSLDQAKDGKAHFEMAKKLAPLREKGVLIIGSGNMVHNLRLIEFPEGDFNQEFGFDWAYEANALFKKLIDKDDYAKLCAYEKLGKAAQLAIPTPEHYFPMLYILALLRDGEKIEYFNDSAVAGSLTMTSFVSK